MLHEKANCERFSPWLLAQHANAHGQSCISMISYILAKSGTQPELKLSRVHSPIYSGNAILTIKKPPNNQGAIEKSIKDVDISQIETVKNLSCE